MVKLIAVQDSSGIQVQVPSEMGVARSDQLVGGGYERLIELAGRVCYDSLGRGRGSGEYFKHIIEARHLSVLEHAVVRFNVNWGGGATSFYNRPGVWIDGDNVEMNFRALAEYACRCDFCDEDCKSFVNYIRSHVQGDLLRSALGIEGEVGEIIPLKFRWYSFYIECSRACANELIRHRYLSAVSQRSTRYCDESETGIVVHPDGEVVRDLFVDSDVSSAKLYREILKALPDTLSRKQKYGIARMVLPLGLKTSLIYTVREDQFERICEQRISDGADAEIRELVQEMKKLVIRSK